MWAAHFRVHHAVFDLIVADDAIDWQQLTSAQFEANFGERLQFLRYAVRLAQLTSFQPDEIATWIVASRHSVPFDVARIILLGERYPSSLTRAQRLNFFVRVLNVLSRGAQQFLP